MWQATKNLHWLFGSDHDLKMNSTEVLLEMRCGRIVRGGGAAWYALTWPDVGMAQVLAHN
jgi:hypothetical protein